MNEQEGSQPSFEGWNERNENWFSVPVQLIGQLANMSPSVVVVVLYVMRHTWGFNETEKRISLDEFVKGRKRRDGSRLDGGTGLSTKTVQGALRKAVESGFLGVREDTTDRARVKKYYHLVERTSPVPIRKNCTPPPVPIRKNSHPDREILLPGLGNFATRSEIDTTGIDTCKKDTCLTDTKRAPAVADHEERNGHEPPSGLLALIDGWNAVADSVRAPKADRNPPSQALLSCWARTRRDKELREAMTDVPKLMQAVQSSRFCHGKQWFKLTWLFTRNRDTRELAVKRILANEFQSDSSPPTRTPDGRPRIGPNGEIPIGQNGKRMNPDWMKMPNEQRDAYLFSDVIPPGWDHWLESTV